MDEICRFPLLERKPFMSPAPHKQGVSGLKKAKPRITLTVLAIAAAAAAVSGVVVNASDHNLQDAKDMYSAGYAY